MSERTKVSAEEERRSEVVGKKPSYESPILQKLNVDSTESKFSTGAELMNGDPATS